MTLKIGEETYKGTGNSKKKAKLIAAAACMEEKVGHCQYNTNAMVCGICNYQLNLALLLARKPNEYKSSCQCK